MKVGRRIYQTGVLGEGCITRSLDFGLKWTRQISSLNGSCRLVWFGGATARVGFWSSTALSWAGVNAFYGFSETSFLNELSRRGGMRLSDGPTVEWSANRLSEVTSQGIEHLGQLAEQVMSNGRILLEEVKISGIERKFPESFGGVCTPAEEELWRVIYCIVGVLQSD